MGDAKKVFEVGAGVCLLFLGYGRFGMRNRFGLTRELPAAVSLRVRQECGFGCVVCGFAIVEYHHFDPPFADAERHDPEKIALLCDRCHGRQKKGLLSDEVVQGRRLDPITFERGYSKEVFELTSPFTLMIGSSRFHNVRSIIRRESGEEWFTIEGPEVVGGPALISAKFYDTEESVRLEIVRNEFRCPPDVWDMTVIGSVLTIRHAKSLIGLKLRSTPPHQIAIERLRMRCGDIDFEITPAGAAILRFGAGTVVTMHATQSTGAEAIYTLP